MMPSLLLAVLDVLTGLMALSFVWFSASLAKMVLSRRRKRMGALSPSRRRFLSALTFGTGANLLGGLALIHGPSWAAASLSILPGSLVFYIIPEAVTDHVPEGILFFVGGIGAILFWAGSYLIAVRAIGLLWGRNHAFYAG
jgi:hypothetical protein